MTQPHSPVALLSILAALTLAGCAETETGPDTVLVTGVVTYEGNPVDGATVLFQPQKPGGAEQTVQAVTGADGKFEVQTHIGGGTYKPGMPAGEYRVAITKLDTGAEVSITAPPKHLLPMKYANPKTSELTATVPVDGEDGLVFAL